MDTVTITASRAASAAPSGGGLMGFVRKVGGALFGDDGLGFKDVLDLVNPLQHIPVVGNVYRNLTGDELAPGIRVAGGALFGGPLGAALSLVGLAVEQGAAHAVEKAGDESAPPGAATAVATTAPTEPPRGGWMLAAASTGSVSAFVPERPALATATGGSAAAARGGWMLSAAQPAPPTAKGAREIAAPTAVEEQAQRPTRELRLPARRLTLPPTPVLPSPLADAGRRRSADEARAAALFATLQRQHTLPDNSFLARV